MQWLDSTFHGISLSGMASPLSVTRLAMRGGERPVRKGHPLWLEVLIRAFKATDSNMRFHKYIHYCIKKAQPLGDLMKKPRR